VIAWQLVVVEIMQFRIMLLADVEHRDGRIVKVCFGGVTTFDGNGCLCEEDCARKEVVFMGTAWMCYDGCDGHGGDVER
jgi:hypothetical protein